MAAAATAAHPSSDYIVPCSLLYIQTRTLFCLSCVWSSFEMARTSAKMDAENRAMCYALRNPPAGRKPISLKDIAGMVAKTDGTHPSVAAVQEASKQFKA